MASGKLKRYFEFSSVEKNRMNGLCKLCHRNYKDLNGTYSNFLKHLKRKHLSEYQESFVRSDDDLSEDIDIPKDQSTSNDPPHMDSKQGRIGSSIAKNLIIKCNLPFSIVENPAFREFIKECYPKWQPISAKKLKSDFIASFKSRIDKVIGEALENINSLTLTIDCWSDRRSRGFLGITGHFIDEQMLPQAYLVDFVRLKSPHTGENIQRATEYVLDRFNIKEKVYRIVTDNAASMIKAYQFGLVVDADHLIDDSSSDNLIPVDLPTPDDDVDQGFNLHHFQFVNSLPVEMKDVHDGIQAVRMSCFIHTLQLTIRDGLQKVSHVQKILEKCQTLARSAQKSSQIADILEQINRHIERPTVTRWNSELMLIKSILSIGKEHIESLSNSIEDSIPFSNSDFCMMEELVDILEPFHQVSIKCQAEKIVTISLVVPSIVHLLCHLRSFKDNLSFCHKLVQQLQSSIETRFAGIIHRLNHVIVQDDDPFNDPLYFMTTLLDPTFKFFWIRDLKLPVNIENRLKQNVIQLVLDEISKDSLTESAARQKTPLTTSSSGSQVKRRKLFSYDNYLANDDNSNEQKPLHPSVEIEAYLNDPVHSKFSDYWQRSRLTSLKTLVTRIFSVQASSAPIERVFSHAGLILSSRRMRINEQLFKDIVFLKANHGLL